MFWTENSRQAFQQAESDVEKFMSSCATLDYASSRFLYLRLGPRSACITRSHIPRDGARAACSSPNLALLYVRIVILDPSLRSCGNRHWRAIRVPWVDYN